MKTTTTERKKPVRRTALQRFEAMRIEALEVQLMCMKAGEPVLAEASGEMGNTARDALLMRVSEDSSPTDFETTGTGGPHS